MHFASKAQPKLIIDNAWTRFVEETMQLHEDRDDCLAAVVGEVRAVMTPLVRMAKVCLVTIAASALGLLVLGVVAACHR